MPVPDYLGSDNGLLPKRRQAIIRTSADILSIRPQGTYFNEILFEIQIFSFMKIHLNMSSVKWRSFCLGGNELIKWTNTDTIELYISKHIEKLKNVI